MNIGIGYLPVRVRGVYRRWKCICPVNLVALDRQDPWSRREGFLKDASTSIVQRDQLIRILGAHRSVKPASDIEPIIARLAFQADALAGFQFVLHLTRPAHVR
jgi:hypothetical protein